MLSGIGGTLEYRSLFILHSWCILLCRLISICGRLLSLMIKFICTSSILVHAHRLSHILRRHCGHLFDLLVDSLEEYLPLFLKTLLASVQQPSDDFGVFELHLCFFVICTFDLNHVDLIDLLFDLLDLFVETFLVRRDHRRLIMSFE
jgi:hypothetical protein